MMKFKDTFYDKKVRYFCISIALLLLGVAAFFIFGFHGDLNVRGGSIVTYPYTGTIEMKDVQLTLNEALENPVNLRTSISTNDENRDVYKRQEYGSSKCRIQRAAGNVSD